MSAFGVVTFQTTSSAMHAEKRLKEAAVPLKLIPTPREISSDCGIAIRFDPSDYDKVRQTLHENSVEFAGIHLLDL